MPQTLVDSLITWADIQSLLPRTTDTEIVFKPKFARDMLKLAINLFKWFRSRNCSAKALEAHLVLFPNSAEETSCNGLMQVSEMVEGTDPGMEDISDNENVVDQETETEMHVDEDLDEDSDADPNA